MKIYFACFLLTAPWTVCMDNNSQQQNPQNEEEAPKTTTKTETDDETNSRRIKNLEHQLFLITQEFEQRGYPLVRWENQTDQKQ
jgi:hypothetical protein